MQRVKEMAMRKGFTQKSLAETLGLSLAMVRGYYQRDNLSISTLTKLAKVFGCEVWQLVASESEVLKTFEGYAKCPKCEERIKVSELQYCYDS